MRLSGSSKRLLRLRGWKGRSVLTSTWYEPFDQQQIIDACVHFVLSFPGVSGFASAGDIHLFPKIVDAVERYGSMNDEEAERILSSISGYTSIFGAPTSIA